MIRSIAAMMVLLLGVCAPARAEGGTLTADGIAVTLDVGPIVFDGPGCTYVPWTVTYSAPEDFWLRVRWQLRQPGSNETVDEDLSLYHEVSGTHADSTCIVDWKHLSRNKKYILTAQIGEYLSASGGSVLASLPPVEIPVYTSRTRFTRLLVRSDSTGYVYARGRVRARTSGGAWIGASGIVEFDVRRRGVWTKFGSTMRFDLDSLGRFQKAFLFSNIRPGEKVRARLVNCHWCTDARLATVVRR